MTLRGAGVRSGLAPDPAWTDRRTLGNRPGRRLLNRRIQVYRGRDDLALGEFLLGSLAAS